MDTARNVEAAEGVGEQFIVAAGFAGGHEVSGAVRSPGVGGEFGTDLRVFDIGRVAWEHGLDFSADGIGEAEETVETGEDGRLLRCHCHDPSWQNWPLLEHAVIGNIVPDFPLINKSFNLGYSGQDL